MTAWSAAALLPVGYRPWRLDLTRYDRSPELTLAERQALAVLLAAHGWGSRTVTLILGQLAGAERLVCPLHEAIAATAASSPPATSPEGQVQA